MSSAKPLTSLSSDKRASYSDISLPGERSHDPNDPCDLRLSDGLSSRPTLVQMGLEESRGEEVEEKQ